MSEWHSLVCLLMLCCFPAANPTNISAKFRPAGDPPLHQHTHLSRVCTLRDTITSFCWHVSGIEVCLAERQRNLGISQSGNTYMILACTTKRRSGFFVSKQQPVSFSRLHDVLVCLLLARYSLVADALSIPARSVTCTLVFYPLLHLLSKRGRKLSANVRQSFNFTSFS